MNPDSLPSFDAWLTKAKDLCQRWANAAHGGNVIESYREAKKAALAHLAAHPSAAPQGAQPVPAGMVPVDLLRQHWLRAVECDHEEKQDKPHCACCSLDLGWHPSVGAAVEAWLAHVQLAAASPADAAPVPQEVREALQEIRDLVWSGKVRYVEHLGGGIWTWPDRAEAALNAGLTIPAKEQPQRDNCEFCLGAKGGVPGNENRIGGHVVCDYCTPLLQDTISKEQR